MRKILLISNFYSEYISAGTSQRTKDIKKGLTDLGCECRVVTIKRSRNPIQKEPDKKEIIGINSLSGRYAIPIYPLLRFFRLLKGYNLVHIIDHWSGLNIISVIFCLVSKTPYIYSPCGALKPIGRNILIKKLYNFIFLKFLLNNAKYIFAVTKKEKSEIKLLSKKKLKIKVIPNGIWEKSETNFQIDRRTKKKLENLIKPKKFILFVGRLSYVKGPDILFDAFLKINNIDKYALVYAGPDENMKGEILKKLRNFPNINVIFLGSVTPKVRNFCMKNALLTVIPSRREAMSMVALETSILGTPFIATKSCGLSDFSINNAGFICEPNSNSISKRLNYLLKNPEEILITGKNAQSYVKKNYTWEKILLEMNSYFK
ncbi:glycosyltransferase [uncultured Prochlorococcus sp.]|uniref:glycosyltransferase n=1 Tax=uncultured Prochlorococcus sp. TaxID=159733 RepID=UPI002588B843|nr:glycosyltransferase [uncultured Prochlorococcus sp.]